MKTQTGEYHFTEQQILNEEEEIRLAKKDLANFNVLYDRYFERIFQFIYQRVQTEDQAAALTSDTFVKAMENLKTYKSIGVPFAAWLFQIARNEINQKHYKQKKLRQVNYSSENIASIIDEIEDQSIDKLELVVEAIKTLNRDETELIEMKYFEKRSYFEMGNILSLTENNVKVKTFRVVQKLKSIINHSNH